MADTAERPTAVTQAVSALVDRVGIHGLPWILWTLICFAAVWKGNEQTLRYLWPWLYWTWVALSLIVFVVIVATFIRSRKSGPKPVVDPSRASDSPPDSTRTV